MLPSSISRRRFLQTTAAASLAAPAFAEPAAQSIVKIALGMDNFAVRAMGWKAPQLIEHAAALQLDTLFISDLDAYDSFDASYLKAIKAKADMLGLALYVGSWSICPTSTRFKKDWGTPAEHITLGLRVASELGSPVFRVILGSQEDRKTPGGIEARIDDTLKVLKESRKEILDSGIKIAIENHAGDMQSYELAQLIEAAGTDIAGVCIDSGNAAWTLEDPLAVLENLGKYTIVSSLRDDQIWESPDGAVVQWTAVGDGVVDWNAYLGKWRALCPHVPFQIETISGFPRTFAYNKPEFWEIFPKVRQEEFARFVELAKKGHAIEPHKAAAGVDKKVDDQEYQKAELARSVKYCRDVLGLGIRGR
ncbi:MAG TPA: sugar phosphate isomerase/epimerase [Chthoniobacteraceae bacterium]|jgi:sugar phosphate isomerase/epimerase|nr:sugar phosphate isomerase/epimerase [Chthoniobacteraceae bacterium]